MIDTRINFYGIDPGVHGAVVVLRFDKSILPYDRTIKIFNKVNGFIEFVQPVLLYAEKFDAMIAPTLVNHLDKGLLSVHRVNSIFHRIDTNWEKDDNVENYEVHCEMPFSIPKTGIKAVFKNGVNFGILLNSIFENFGYNNNQFHSPREWTDFVKKHMSKDKRWLDIIKKEKKHIAGSLFYTLLNSVNINDIFEDNNWHKTSLANMNGVYDAFVIALYGALRPYNNENYKIEFKLGNEYTQYIERNL